MYMSVSRHILPLSRNIFFFFLQCQYFCPINTTPLLGMKMFCFGFGFFFFGGVYVGVSVLGWTICK